MKQIGHALLTFTPPATPGSSTQPEPESYLITLPNLYIESLITGSPFVELDKFTQIASSTGYIAKINYSGRGWVSGKKNTFSAALWKEGEGDEKKPLYTAEGQWNESFVIRKGGKKGEEIDSYNAQKTKTTPLTVAPVEEQDPYESRRAWGKVAQSIQKGDLDAASQYKSRIEVAQRNLRKQEREENREWERRFFYSIKETDDALFKKLVKMISGYNSWPGVEADKTAGVWRFDEKTKDAKPPYHAEGPKGLGEGTSSEPLSRTSTQQTVL